MSSPPPASEAAAQALGRLGSDVRDLDPAVHGEDLNAATGYALEDIATVREYVAALEARVEVELELRKAAYERIAVLEARLAEAEREIERLRAIPPLVRITLEKALRLDMTKPPVTNKELRAAIQVLPEPPSFFAAVNGMRQLAEAKDRLAEAERALREADGWLYHATEGGGMKSARRARDVIHAALPPES